ncbi:MAG: TRAP transporter small permease subunit [Alphaproteobacteria bacterium]|nr:TRAP transporter small permease subunit [Alphaproteobacteria bacterium]
MPNAIRLYVRYVEKASYRVGRFAMYLIFLLMGILLYSSISKTFFVPSLWTLEMAQFTMVAYYILGGPYAMQLDEHVRMDLLYANWSPKTKAAVDAFTVLFLIFYLGMVLYGGWGSTEYALKYGERSYSAWAPYMAPLKILICLGVLLMLLQTIAVFFKDIATVLDKEISVTGDAA